MKVNTQSHPIQLSLSIIEKAASPNGFVASLDDNDNYNRIWTRDAMITSIAVLCQEKKSLYPVVKNDKVMNIVCKKLVIRIRLTKIHSCQNA